MPKRRSYIEKNNNIKRKEELHKKNRIDDKRKEEKH
jgi:hypothetical protein